MGSTSHAFYPLGVSFHDLFNQWIPNQWKYEIFPLDNLRGSTGSILAYAQKLSRRFWPVFALASEFDYIVLEMKLIHDS